MDPRRLGEAVGVAVLVTAVLAGCSADRDRDGDWRLVGSSPTSSTVEVLYFHGDCDELRGATVTSTATSVNVRLREHRLGDTCDSAGRFEWLQVRLGAPLHARVVTGQCTTGSCTGPLTPEPSGERERVVGPH